MEIYQYKLHGNTHAKTHTHKHRQVLLTSCEEWGLYGTGVRPGLTACRRGSPSCLLGLPSQTVSLVNRVLRYSMHRHTLHKARSRYTQTHTHTRTHTCTRTHAHTQVHVTVHTYTSLYTHASIHRSRSHYNTDSRAHNHTPAPP